MCEVTCTVLLLDQERIGSIGHMLGADTYRPLQLCSVRAQVYDSTALIHIYAGTHEGITVPEQLLVGTVQNISPQSTLRLSVGLLLTIVISELRHGHIGKLTFLLQVAVILHTVFITLLQQFVRLLPTAHFVQPAGSYEHHVVCVSVVVLLQGTILIDQVVQIRILPGLGVIDHTTQYVLRMGSEVGAIAVIACQQVSGQVRDCYDTAVLCLISCRCMGVLFGRDPGCPGAAIHEGIPGVVAGMICLGAFLPTGCYRTFYGRIGCFDIIGQICIHVVRSGGFGIESELLMELAEYIIHDRLFVFHGEHPDTEILGLVLLTEFCAGQSQQRQCDLIAVLLMICLSQCYRFVIEQGSVGHLNGGLQTILVRSFLLKLENIQRLC